MNIRLINENDYIKVADMIADSITNSNFAHFYPKSSIEEIKKSLDAKGIEKRASWTHFYVIEDNNEIVACGAIGPYYGSEEESSLFSIFVASKYQSKGYGRKIIEVLENDEYFLRAKRVEIPASITAVEFYKHFGYGFKRFGHIVDSEGILRMEKYPKVSDNNADYNQYIVRPYLDNKYHNYKDFIINLNSNLDSDYVDSNSKNIKMIELNGETIGFYEDISLDDTKFEIKNIYLDSNFRNKGYGRRIIEDFITLYDKDVEVFVDDTLVNYFKKINFEVIDSVNNKYKMLRRK